MRKEPFKRCKSCPLATIPQKQKKKHGLQESMLFHPYTQPRNLEASAIFRAPTM